jgi:hypothetical protein
MFSRRYLPYGTLLATCLLPSARVDFSPGVFAGGATIFMKKTDISIKVTEKLNILYSI